MAKWRLNPHPHLSGKDSYLGQMSDSSGGGLSVGRRGRLCPDNSSLSRWMVSRGKNKGEKHFLRE